MRIFRFIAASLAVKRRHPHLANLGLGDPFDGQIDISIQNPGEKITFVPQFTNSPFFRSVDSGKPDLTKKEAKIGYYLGEVLDLVGLNNVLSELGNFMIMNNQLEINLSAADFPVDGFRNFQFAFIDKTGDRVNAQTLPFNDANGVSKLIISKDEILKLPPNPRDLRLNYFDDSIGTETVFPIAFRLPSDDRVNRYYDLAKVLLPPLQPGTTGPQPVFPTPDDILLTALTICQIIGQENDGFTPSRPDLLQWLLDNDLIDSIPDPA
ncbi:MAG TPA: hypothetical protein PKE06_15240 [Flavilitoribacter sp.]|nr:hypothetical protein [Flavilitoribacter sp.]